MGGDAALLELFITPPPPNEVKETDQLKEVALEPPTTQAASTKWPSRVETELIETDSQFGNGLSTPDTEDEGSDEEARQKIAMIDLDPEPIL